MVITAVNTPGGGFVEQPGPGVKAGVTTRVGVDGQVGVEVTVPMGVFVNVLVGVFVRVLVSTTGVFVGVALTHTGRAKVNCNPAERLSG